MLSAVANGVLHDQVAARVSLESFTVGHPGVIDTQSPTLLVSLSSRDPRGSVAAPAPSPAGGSCSRPVSGTDAPI